MVSLKVTIFVENSSAELWNFVLFFKKKKRVILLSAVS